MTELSTGKKWHGYGGCKRVDMFCLAPAQRDIELDLLEEEQDGNAHIGKTSFVVLALEIQRDQITARREEKEMGTFPTVKAQVSLARRKEKILQQYEKLMESAERLFPDLDMGDLTYRSGSTSEALSLPLPIPSNIRNLPMDMEHLREIELQLRIGELNDALAGIWEQLALKAYLFRHQIRPGRTTKPKTRAWSAIQRETRALQLWRKKYDAARQTLSCLGAPANVQSIYQKLTDDDLKTVTRVIDPNARGQSKETLAWFWFLRNPNDLDQTQDLEYLEEGMSSLVSHWGMGGSPFHSVLGELVESQGPSGSLERGGGPVALRNGLVPKFLQGEVRRVEGLG